MTHYLFLTVNVVLIVVCIVMALVFLFVPTQDKEGLRSYRISLRFLAFSYIALSVSTLMNLLFNTYNLYFTIDFTAISLQTVLFSFSLILLVDIFFANRKFVLKHLAPTFFFVILSLFLKRIWGDPVLQTINDFKQNFTHPIAMLNILFGLFCIAQIIYFLRIFLMKKNLYEQKLNNYYADTYPLKLRWVTYCFYAAFAFVILVITSMFISNPIFSLIMVSFYSVFYIVFGLFYIQYPSTYNIIEPIFNNSSFQKHDELINRNRLFSWDTYKEKLISEKYYLRSEINLDEMAKYLKIGRTTLSNFINKEENLNFHSWINLLRIKEAQQLFLTDPNISITQVSEHIGYSESSNFSRQFKQITGDSPSYWREKNINTPHQV